jgi:epsilon-lactone hydrolase
MRSIRSRLFILLLKYRHLLQFKLKRTTEITRSTSIPGLRTDVEKSAGFFGKLPDGFTLLPEQFGSFYAEWMLPPGALKNKAILYFHGGGLVIGSVKAHRAIVAKFVKGSGVPAFVFDYALAPEHPYPEGLNDSVAAYRHLLEEGTKPQHIVFMGDSGGGNLVLTTLLALKEQGLPLPSAAVTLSAWTDLTNRSESFKSNERKDSLCWKEAQTVFSEYYAGSNDPELPLISPLYGDHQSLPPLLMYAGSDELMRDDSTRFAEKAADAGVDVTLRIGDGMFHCYPACAPLFPEANTALNEICAFIRKHTGG